MKKTMVYFLAVFLAGSIFVPSGHAFFIGRDKFTAEDYKKAQIEFEHKMFAKDTYKFMDEYITQKEAEMLTDLYKRAFDDVEPNGVESETSKKTYLKVARIFLEYTKKLYQKIYDLKHSRK